MDVYIKVDSKMTRKKDMELFNAQMAKSMKEIGEMIGSTANVN